jgi:CheY-like chemotaxis protein
MPSQNKKILIVEDELDTAEMLEEMLLLSGYHVVKSHGGASSIKLITHEQPDVMILDIMMPDVSGLEVLRFIRRDPRLLHIPVIIVSARGLPIDRQIGINAGANAYLTKPVSFLELQNAVDQVVHIQQPGTMKGIS